MKLYKGEIHSRYLEWSPIGLPYGRNRVPMENSFLVHISPLGAYPSEALKLN